MEGRGALVQLSRAGRPPIECRLVDISQGGFSVRAVNLSVASALPPGTAMAAAMPGNNVPILVRVVRDADGVIALMAQQIPEVMGATIRAIDAVAAMRRAA